MRDFDKIVRQLKAHFAKVMLRPPADAAIRGMLQQRLPTVPDVLLSFWQYCDGIEVTHDEGDLFGVQRALDAYPVCDDVLEMQRLLPLRGDGCGDYDCLVIGDGPCEGAVVFWDHEVYEGAAYLLAGTFLSYLDIWADRLVHQYLPDGQRNPRGVPSQVDTWPWLSTPEYRHPWPFDENWLRERDSVADKWLSDESSRRWLLRQDDL